MYETLPASYTDAIDAVAHAEEYLRAAEVAKAIAIAKACELYEVDEDKVAAGFLSLDGEVGGPQIAEYIATELGPILQLSPGAAMREIDTVVRTRHCFPTVWETFLAGAIRWKDLTKVHWHTGQLDPDQCRTIDRKIAHALALTPWARVVKNLRRWVLDIDRAKVKANIAFQADRRGVQIQIRDDGLAYVSAFLTAGDGIALEQVLDDIAKTLPEPELDLTDKPHLTDTQRAELRRDAKLSTAFGVLARQAYGQDLLPTHHLVVHIDADDAWLQSEGDTGTADVEGIGVFLTEQLTDLLAHSNVIVRPVINPASVPESAGYRPSDLLRFAIGIRNPVDVFPYGTRPARFCDLDHTQPYVHGKPGQTTYGNLGPMSRKTHRAKTHAGWQTIQLQPGVFHMTSPLGYQYLTTPEGTIKLWVPRRPSPPECDLPPEPPEQHLPPEWDPWWDSQPAPSPESEAWIIQQALFGLTAA